MVWLGKKSGDEKNHKVDNASSSSNQKVESEAEREKKLQEIDEQITVVLPIIRNDK